MEAKPVDEDLRKLQSLLDDGVITESEFTEKKRQLLDQPALPATTTCASLRSRTDSTTKSTLSAPCSRHFLLPDYFCCELTVTGRGC